MKNKFTNWYLSDEVRKKAELSASETEGMADRALRCPNCGHVTGILYEDLRIGHFATKCMRCHFVFTVNFEYFKRPGLNPFNSGIPLRFCPIDYEDHPAW